MRHVLIATPLLCLALVACGDKDDTSADSGTEGAADATTYYADLAPVLANNCTRCHHDGGLGAADFTDPDTVVAWGDAILGAVQDGRMPPAVSEADCQEYLGVDDMTVDAEELAVMEAWVAGGKQLGDPVDEPEVVPVQATLPDPDLVLTLPEPYTPVYLDDVNPDNEYRCFVLDTGLEEDTYITAMAPIVDQEAMVHHTVLFSAPKEGFDEANLDPQGVNCIDGMGDLDSANGMVSAWAPGMLPIELPEGAGIALKADHYLILQMHYYANGASEGLSDQTGYGFNLTESVDDVVQVAPIGSFDFSIPAGEESHTHTDSLYNEYIDIKIYGVFPHMHRLGVSYDNWIDNEDGSSTCLTRGPYDFDNQLTYQYPEPITFERGSTLNWSCTWNNSTSNPALEGSDPVRTGYGERTDEEMCYFFSLISY